ncbi:very short patch repair endonuclease [Gemmatimonadota bacterium]
MANPLSRSEMMARVRSRDTGPEITVRQLLHSAGFRFRLHRMDLPGTPDIVLPKYRTVVFVNGCFWHGHSGCRRSSLPSTNREFWKRKIHRNKERDASVVSKLRAIGWKVVIVWECEIAEGGLLLKRLAEELRGKGIQKAHSHSVPGAFGRPPFT